MGRVNIVVDVELTEINCGECGGVYAINERYRAQKQENGGFWKCPYCKCGWGYGESELDKVKKRLDNALSRANQEAENRAAVERQLSAQKAATTRLKKRAKAGTCPCCSRTFKQLSVHMRKQHPDFNPEDS